MKMDNEGRSEEGCIYRVEMRAIVTAIYNRVYQPEFEDEILFPVSALRFTEESLYLMFLVINANFFIALTFPWISRWKRTYHRSGFQQGSRQAHSKNHPALQFC